MDQQSIPLGSPPPPSRWEPSRIHTSSSPGGRPPLLPAVLPALPESVGTIVWLSSFTSKAAGGGGRLGQGTETEPHFATLGGRSGRWGDASRTYLPWSWARCFVSWGYNFLLCATGSVTFTLRVNGERRWSTQQVLRLTPHPPPPHFPLVPARCMPRRAPTPSATPDRRQTPFPYPARLGPGLGSRMPRASGSQSADNYCPCVSACGKQGQGLWRGPGWGSDSHVSWWRRGWARA